MDIILAPIDKYFADSKRLFHFRNYQIGMLLLKQASESVRKTFGLVISNRRIQGYIHLQSLGAGSLGEGLQLEPIEDVAQPKGNLTAENDVSRRTRIEIEDHHRGLVDLLRARERSMQ